ncbi:hypothetical protein [Bacteroides sp. GD17]|uniref:hypothetical protein n=1 Tax=Bacteroides sp. GD17 TaxID=3139826 RepID=UPI00313F1C71
MRSGFAGEEGRVVFLVPVDKVAFPVLTGKFVCPAETAPESSVTMIRSDSVRSMYSGLFMSYFTF